MKKLNWHLLGICCLGLIAFAALQFQPYGHAEVTSPDGRPDTSANNPTAEAVNPKKLPTVKVETIEASQVTRVLELTGSVIPTRTAKIASPAEGPVMVHTIGNNLVREGDSGTTDQKLFQIGRNKSAEAELAAARQALQEHSTELSRIEQLAEAGAVPGAQVDAARSRYESAKAQLVKSRESNADYSVSAPWEGIIAKINVTEGEYVAPRSVLAEVFDPESLVVQSAVPETRATEVALGMAVLVELDAHPGKVLEAEITRVFPGLDVKMRTRTVEATLSDSIPLLPGMFARIKVVLSMIPDAITVPSYSLVVAQDGSYSAFVVEDGKTIRRNLEIGPEINGRVQILAGLKAGERLIVAGQEKLEDGAMVKVAAPSAQRTETAALEGTHS